MPRECAILTRMSEPPIKTYTGRHIDVYRAAEILSVSRDTVRRMIAQGTLIAWRPNPHGRKRLLWEAQVLELAEAQQREAVEDARYRQLSLSLFGD